jgi:hypothetical protein
MPAFRRLSAQIASVLADPRHPIQRDTIAANDMARNALASHRGERRPRTRKTMLQKFALAAVATAFFAAAIPAEAAMPGPTASGHQATHSADYATPVKAKRHRTHVKKRVCGPTYKWRWVWRYGHMHKVKVRTGYTCHWKWVPIWRY